ncbi:MAG: tetratricopeptide repeat-containing sensor histidine kinase [Bacteroidota bacterium]
MARSELDSLMATLPTASGAERLKVLNELPQHLLNEKPELAYQYTQDALQLAKSLQDKANIAKAYQNFGEYYYVVGKFDSSVLANRRALFLRRERNDSIGIAQSLNDLGALYDVKSNLDSALVYYFGALDILNALDADGKLETPADNQILSTTLSNIAVCYHAQEKLELSIQYLKRGLEIDEKQGDQNNIGFDLSNIGSIYTAMEEYDSAIVYHKRALEIRRRSNSKLQTSRSLHSLADAYRKTGAREEAVQHLLEALAYKRDFGVPYETAVTLMYLGDLYNEMGRFRDALAYASEGGFIADTLNSNALLTRYCEVISVTQAGLGNYEEAYKLNRRYMRLKDSLRQSKRDVLVEELSAKYETVQKEKRISDLESQNALADLDKTKLRNGLYVLFGGLVIAILMAILVLNRFLAKRAKNRVLHGMNQELGARNQDLAASQAKIEEQRVLLQKQNQEIRQMNTKLENMVDERTRNLQSANRELDLFLYQSSHALRGPLMRLMGLFSIIREEKDNAVVAVMQEKVDYTIRAMDRMLHKLMDVTEIQRRDPQAEAVALRNLIEGHVREIESEMHYPAAEIVLDVPETNLLVPEKYLVNVVLRNLLENALHFRVPDRTHKVHVEVRHSRSELNIRVTDNGIGIPAEHLDSVFSMFFRGTAESPGMGLGLYVMKKAVDLLHGETGIKSQENAYTEVFVRLPIDGIVESPPIEHVSQPVESVKV